MAETEFIVDPEFRSLIPAISAEEYRQLEANVRADGCRDPLVVWDGTLLDGHNRFEICTQHDIPYTTTTVELADRDAAKVWILKNQLGRRNLTTFQRCELGHKLEPFVAIEMKKRQQAGGGSGPSGHQKLGEAKTTDREVAKVIGVSHATYAKSKPVKKNADDDTLASLRRPGGTSIDKEYKAEKSEQRRQKRNERNAQLSAERIDAETVPPASVLLCDPPWKYDYSPTDTRKIENQYPTMSLNAICELKDEVQAICTPDAVLYLWATSPKLEEAFKVLRAWGFKYRTCAVWDKKKIGMGYYFRQQHELLLVAIRGELPPPEEAHRVSSVFRAPRGKHSEKPEAVYEFLEAAYPEPLAKRELFARKQRPGWLPSWGNEL
jgi:N6-adenosine-specific RNA methylase IME4